MSEPWGKLPPKSVDIKRAADKAMSPPRIAGYRGVYWPEQKKVGSPALQWKMGGCKRVSHYFDHKNWAHEDLGRGQMGSFSQKEWCALADSWRGAAYLEKEAKRAEGQDRKGLAKITPHARRTSLKPPEPLKHNPFGALASLKK
jgi:hypothetical protein